MTTVVFDFNKTDIGEITDVYGVDIGDVKDIYEINVSGNRGVFGGGYAPSTYYNRIDYITISTPSNATDFGDLTVARNALPATSNGETDRGVFGGGSTASMKNEIDYITISNPSNATDFGDMTYERHLLAGTSNSTNDRGVFGGGADAGANYSNIIDYITISSTSNTVNFGDLTGKRMKLTACSNATNNRGVFAGGEKLAVPYYAETIDYITISSTGNATDFGDLTVERGSSAACSNGTNDRGVFGGGRNSGTQYNIIEYITISSTSNSTNFGDLTAKEDHLASTSNMLLNKGVFGGGAYTSTIDYINIDSLGDAADFGDLTLTRGRLAATSNA